jgi:hypothetical protein
MARAHSMRFADCRLNSWDLSRIFLTSSMSLFVSVMAQRNHSVT